MKHHALALSLVGFLALASTAEAEESQLDAASTEGLIKTQALLRDPALRDKSGKESKEAAAALKTVDSVSGSDSKISQEIHELSAEIFENLTRESGGDAGKMAELLAKMQADPNTLEKRLTPEQRAHLSSISKRAPASEAK